MVLIGHQDQPTLGEASFSPEVVWLISLPPMTHSFISERGIHRVSIVASYNAAIVNTRGISRRERWACG
jgi:hypothetical protein